VVVLVEQPDPAQVRAAAVVEVQPTEAQSTLDAVELGQGLGVHGGRDVAFGAGLRRAAGVAEGRTEPVLGLLANGIESAVEGRNVCLFLVQFGFLGVRGARGEP
jgi:hypothetical protein